MFPNDIPRRRNGFTSPYNIPQISAWIALLATLLHFVLGITPILPLKASIPLTLFFLFLIGLVLLYGMRAIAVDSMDVYLEEHLRAHRNGTICKESRWKDSIYNAYNPPRTAPPTAAATEHDDTMKQCWICDVQVVDSSMHCKYCNKCVGKFDHHCMCKWAHLPCLSLSFSLCGPQRLSLTLSTTIIMQGSIHVSENAIMKISFVSCWLFLPCKYFIYPLPCPFVLIFF